MGANVNSVLTQNDLDGQSLFLLAGPCVIESERLCLSVAERLAQLSQKYQVTIIFKSSYDKANRTSLSSFRGPGIEEGLKILQKVKDQTGLPEGVDPNGLVAAVVRDLGGTIVSNGDEAD